MYNRYRYRMSFTYRVKSRGELRLPCEPGTFRSENEYLSHHPQNDRHRVVAITDLFRYRYTTLPPVSLWIGTNVERLEPCTFRSESETATAGSDVVQSGRPIFDDFFQHLWPYIGNNTANVVFQMVKRLWLIRIDQ
ncbi:hypothetical protein TNCV_2714341 [Trichonephila clavipes]|nr:hypothetical protein TNCV_2714341 [Trichonephila clavipes]